MADHSAATLPTQTEAPLSGPGRPTMSVAMIATNEEKNLPRTLGALGWVDEIVIVDSGSVDRSPEIARSFGAKHSFNRDFRGHAEQKNVAIRQCTGDWILLLDADEVVTPALAEEIRQAIQDSTHNAFWMPRLNLFLSRWMRHGGLFPDTKLRLFRRGVAMVEEGAGPHGTPLFSEHKGLLRNHLEHFGYPDFALYLDHMNEYSTGTVDPLLRKHRTTARPVILALSVLNPLGNFVKNYIFRLGFLDGAEGFVFHLNHAVYVHWKFVKLWEKRSTGIRPDRER